MGYDGGNKGKDGKYERKPRRRAADDLQKNSGSAGGARRFSANDNQSRRTGTSTARRASSNKNLRRQASKKENRKTVNKAIAIELTALIAAAAVFFAYVVLTSKLLSTTYAVLLIIVLVAVVAGVALLGWYNSSQKSSGKRAQYAAFAASALITVVFAIIFIVGGIYVMKTVSTMQEVGGVTTEVSDYNVYVLEDDPAENIQDAANYTFGILETQDRDNIDIIVTEIEEELGSSIEILEYPGVTGIADALTDNEIDAMIIGAAFMEMYKFFEDYETFDETTKIIWSGEVENKIDVVPENLEELNGVITIYISGSDTRQTTLPTRSLSDVNLLVRVNLDTHQILIVTTPRDYYVQTSVSGTAYDKLTHAGAYGVQCSMDTLEALYGIDIDYYVRLNFVGFKDIIDALGGVDVWSDYEITTKNMAGYKINYGYNHMDGTTALAYARERYSYATGDHQRGKNQMEVLKAVINSLTSSSVLTNYLDILDSAEGCFETSMPYSVMAELVAYQLKYGGSWDMVTYNVIGTGANKSTYSLSSPNYVMIPDFSTVEIAVDLFNQIAAGEIISDPNETTD